MKSMTKSLAILALTLCTIITSTFCPTLREKLVTVTDQLAAAALETASTSGIAARHGSDSTCGAATSHGTDSTYQTSLHYEVAIVLNHNGENPFEWRSPISQAEYRQAKTLKRPFITRYSKRALKALARKLGYFERMASSTNVTRPAISVKSVTITDLRHNRQVNLSLRG